MRVPQREVARAPFSVVGREAALGVESGGQGGGDREGLDGGGGVHGAVDLADAERSAAGGANGLSGGDVDDHDGDPAGAMLGHQPVGDLGGLPGGVCQEGRGLRRGLR